MAYIYVITNLINQKQYVGKTMFTVEKRWKEHLIDAKKQRVIHRPLYNAIQKYAAENFNIAVLEQCLPEESSEKEKFWIQKLNTYYNGYNATLGGDGRISLDYAKIVRLFDTTLKSQQEIANDCNCSIDSVRNIVSQYFDNVDWNLRWSKQHKPNNLNIIGKSVRCIEKDLIFPSSTRAANWLVENGKIKSQAYGRTHIPDVCKGLRKTVGGYHWEYVE